MEPTLAQKKYLEILFNDLGYDRTQRYAWLSAELDRRIHCLDDLTSREASVMIDMLKAAKEERINDR